MVREAIKTMSASNSNLISSCEYNVNGVVRQTGSGRFLSQCDFCDIRGERA